jgi:hypothetical protein
LISYLTQDSALSLQPAFGECYTLFKNHTQQTDILRGINGEFSGAFAKQLQKATIIHLIRISVLLYACKEQPDPTDFHKISYVPFLLRLSRWVDFMKITDNSHEGISP